MAVAYGSSLSIAGGTGTTTTSGNITLSGANLVLVLEIALKHATATVSSVSWSLGSGTAVEVKSGGQRNTDCLSTTWAIPAPTTGTGTYTANFSTSVPWQINADYFTGTDQVTPCPSGDAVGANAGANITNITLSPTNVTANDAQAGLGADTTGDVSSYSPNQTFLNDSTLVNMECGYRIGTGSVVANFVSNTAGVQSAMAVRIQAASAANPYLSPPDPIYVQRRL